MQTSLTKNASKMKALYTFLVSCFGVGLLFSQTDIASVEYFFDTDPGFGNGTSIDINPDAASIDQNFNISTSGLTVGTHRLFLRAINVDGTSSMYEHKTFRVAPVSDSNTSTLVEAEYFFDTDPGFGNATLIDIVDIDNLDDVLTVSTSGLSVGTHRLFIRVKNAAGVWSIYDHKTFRVAPVSDVNTTSITAAEYFVDIDPGVGLATSIMVSGDVLDENLSLSTSVSLANGTHYLYIRTQNADGIWSLYERQEFTSDGALGVDDEALDAISVFPNPTTDFIKINLPVDNRIEKAILYDMTGKEVRSLKKPFDTIGIENLQSGVYLLIIETEKGSVSKKIIKN